MSPKATLYLDIDGVVNFFGSRTRHRKTVELGYLRRGSAYAEGYLYTLNWSSELLLKLSRIEGLEIALLSTWNTQSESLFNALQWETDRVLNDVAGFDSDWRKLDEILMDQAENPRPFIWADDTATRLNPELDQSFTRLAIKPDPVVGLTETHLSEIEEFVRKL